MTLHRPRALIVDKASAETTQLVAALESNGFDVKWVKDGEQAFNVGHDAIIRIDEDDALEKREELLPGNIEQTACAKD